MQIMIANLTVQQQRFLADVVALLTDPARATELAALSDGSGLLAMRANGHALVTVEEGNHGAHEPANGRTGEWARN